jgi:enamine deaminase RidA (YjgF/YER057c/UK114 family)
MKLETTPIEAASPALRDGMEVRAFERDSFTEYYVTGSPIEGLPPDECAQAQFEETARTLLQHRIQPIQEKIYGLRSAMDTILDAREAVFLRHGLDPTTPITFIEGKPVGNCPLGGLQIWGVVPHDPEKSVVSTVESHGRKVGRCWSGEGFRMLHLPFIRGTSPEGKLPSCATGQAERMFANASALLKSGGFSFSQVVRTWIYMARLLDWYGEFNRVRTGYFKREGFGWEKGETAFPASTGIQGRCFSDECFMDVLALDSGAKAATVHSICRTSRQSQAFSYGSAFSRGASIAIEGRQTVFVSGTASINARGDSVYIGDAEAQSVGTLSNIAGLLEDHGGGLENIAMATVFCKNVEACEAFRRITRLLQLPAFPAVFVIADVCRHELLVEIEAVAVI